MSSGPTSSSPWSAFLQNSADRSSLSLPTIRPRPPSPSDFLVRRAITLNPPHQLQVSSRPHPQTSDINLPSRAGTEDPFIDIDFGVSSQDSSPDRNMAPPVRALSVVDLTSSPLTSPRLPSKKRKSSGGPSSTSKRAKVGSAPAKPRRSSTVSNSSLKIEAVDLVDVDDDERYAEYNNKSHSELNNQQSDDGDGAIRLAAFQCIICLDNPTDLVITHCGHMFCSFCLHEALHVSTSKRACPVCRQGVTLPRPGSKAKSYYSLEMKLMTARKKGKQPQR